MNHSVKGKHVETYISCSLKYRLDRVSLGGTEISVRITTQRRSLPGISDVGVDTQRLLTPTVSYVM